jgi:hypothetical protein
MFSLFDRWVISKQDRSGEESTTGCLPALEALEDRTAPAVLFSPLPPAAPATAPLSANPATAYVQALYLDVMGRNATSQEIQTWAPIVKAFGPAQAVSGILNSPESQARIVDNLYVELLGRHAEPSGLAYWEGQLTGHGLESVTAGIASSYEFLSKHPGNAVFAEYQGLLNRAPTATEVAKWTPILNSQGAQAVALGIESTAEFRSNVTQFVFVQDLSRPGTAAELASYANNPGLNLLQIQVSLLTSPEFVHSFGL